MSMNLNEAIVVVVDHLKRLKSLREDQSTSPFYCYISDYSTGEFGFVNFGGRSITLVKFFTSDQVEDEINQYIATVIKAQLDAVNEELHNLKKTRSALSRKKNRLENKLKIIEMTSGPIEENEEE